MSHCINGNKEEKLLQCEDNVTSGRKLLLFTLLVRMHTVTPRYAKGKCTVAARGQKRRTP